MAINISISCIRRTIKLYVTATTNICPNNSTNSVDTGAIQTSPKLQFNSAHHLPIFYINPLTHKLPNEAGNMQRLVYSSILATPQAKSDHGQTVAPFNKTQPKLRFTMVDHELPC